MEGFRFALLFDGASLERWHLDCLDRLGEVAELTDVIIGPDETILDAPTDSMLMRWYARRVDTAPIASVVERLAALPRHAADRLDALETATWDFVLKLGLGPFPAGLEQRTRLGVWYFEHETRGAAPPFFREVYDAEDVTRAALLALHPQQPTPAILEEGFFRTEKRSYVATRDRVVDAIAAWPARVCSRVGVDTCDPPAPRREPPPPSGAANRMALLRYRTRVARRRLSFAWERLFRHPQWNIGILDVPAGALVASGTYIDDRIEWLPLDARKSFLADPFGIVRDGTLHVLCERFVYREGKGHICTLDVRGERAATQPERTIELPVHMSYPFLVETSEMIYCIPETSTANEVALFRADEFPRTWSKLAVLVPELAGVDPTVFRHDGSWWLMCTRKGALEDVELWVWHASSLLGPWIAHARNPVKTDVRSSRPGGRPFRHEGALYRPAQDCSRSYGWRIAIQRITRLTPTEFLEEQVTVLEASPESPFPRGRHTLTPVGNVVLVDGRRDVFVWAAFSAFLGIWGADLRGKLQLGRRLRPRH